MARDTVVALYERRDEAEAARVALLDAGYSDLDIELVADGGYGGSNDGHGGLFALLTGWGVPSDDAHGYAEGVRRGGAVLAVSLASPEAAKRARGLLSPARRWTAPPDDGLTHGGLSNDGLTRGAAALRDANAATPAPEAIRDANSPAPTDRATTGEYPRPELGHGPARTPRTMP